MISVIICSIRKALAQQVQKNIAATIGVVWEPIIIDNTQSPQSIAKVYNLGAARAQYDIVCFVHEDVLFQTPGWGAIIVELFKKDAATGLIGIAGSKYKSSCPAGWFCGIEESDCCNIMHVDTLNQQQHIYLNPAPGAVSQEVVVLDGVFLCCLKSVWAKVRFDDALLKGFHLYDIDFSFRVAQNYKVIVTFEIDLMHLTQGGSFGNEWINYTLLWHAKMKPYLPAWSKDLLLHERKYEAIIVRNWLIRLKHEDISFKNKISWLWQSKIGMYFTAWPFVILYLLKKYVKK